MPIFKTNNDVPDWALREMVTVGAIVTPVIETGTETINGQPITYGPEITSEEFIRLYESRLRPWDANDTPPPHYRFQRIYTD